MTEDAATPEPYKTVTIRPKHVAEGKAVQLMYKTDTMMVMGQTISASGGETELHVHEGSDAVWLVLEGEAMFYGEGDRLIATLRRNDTLLIPHGAPYWFKSSGTTDLHIVRFGAKVPGVEDRRTVLVPAEVEPKFEVYT